MTTGKFVKFPSIEKFSDVNALVKRRYVVEDRPTITYRGKVKLHGTNAGIRVDPDGTITCLKRTGVCNVQNDNAGFANWVETIKDHLTPMVFHRSEFQKTGELKTIGFEGLSYIIYGEWAGPGIQKKVAVSSIEKKSFFPFAVYLPESTEWIVEPSNIEYFTNNVPDTYVVPWGTEEFLVDFRLQSSMEAFTSTVGNLVEICDKVDPYIKDRFGIEGIGEGYVFYPLYPLSSATLVNHDYIFKAKGKSHTVAAHEATNRIQIDPTILEGVAAFAKEFVTPARCEQGLNEACGGEAVMTKIGAFMAWIGPDVKKESVNELEASGLEWKNVAKAVNQQARDWFIRATEGNVECL